MKTQRIHKTYRPVGILVIFICLLIPKLVFPQTAWDYNTGEQFNGDQIQNNFTNSVTPKNLNNSTIEITENFAIAGAPNENTDTDGAVCLPNAGAAYIYELDAYGDWLQKQKIVASDREESDLFGWTTAISGDYAVVSAPNEDHDNHGALQANSSGSVYIFQRDGKGNWIEKQKIVASDRSPNDQFGRSISISGNYLIIGADKKKVTKNSYSSIPTTGVVYIFERSQTGYWKEIQKISAASSTAASGFGYRVSIFDNYAIIGASGQDLSSNEHLKNNQSEKQGVSDADSAYIYERNAKGIWKLKQKIIDPKLTFLCLEKLY